ncbi:hypothetical protein KQX54_010975 [Cotesia glomerata]|uniref:Uncharacterized protein n=1 Tax=Cotesia glomerata TaxID=32391 RepID=A0AAV7J5T9_COTGL|nr:hypothetical protein KQX54_010975 [Cotesia glomerata]
MRSNEAIKARKGGCILMVDDIDGQPDVGMLDIAGCPTPVPTRVTQIKFEWVVLHKFQYNNSCEPFPDVAPSIARCTTVICKCCEFICSRYERGRYSSPESMLFRCLSRLYAVPLFSPSTLVVLLPPHPPAPSTSHSTPILS